MKRRKNLSLLMIGLSLLSLWLITFKQPVQAFAWTFGQEDTEALTDEDLRVIQSVYQMIKESYIEDVDKEVLLEGALKGMVNATGDDYSEFLNAKQAEAIEEDIEGSFTGIGVQFTLEEGVPTVITPIEGTPAAEAGLQPQDLILKADGVDLLNMDTQEIVDLIRGPIGEPVELEIERGGIIFTETIIRAEIPIITVNGEITEEHSNIALISVNQFNGTTTDELIEVIEKMREEGAEKFIFDFRYNPGGLLDIALELCNMFVEEGQVMMQIEERIGEPITYISSKEFGDFKVTEPYVFLINGGSASASEILAANILENTSYPVMGTTSFGKGTVQTIIEQGKYGELKLTFAKWLTPKGTWIHQEGLEPTEYVEPNPLQGSIRLALDETYEEGSVGEMVHTISLVLSQCGYDIEEQMIFDEKMVSAVKAFQKDHQLEESGQVTQETAREINELAQKLLEEDDRPYQRAIEWLETQHD